MSAKFRTYGRSKLWSIIVTLVLFALIGAVVGVFIKLDRQTTTDRLGAEAYSIGAIDEKGEFKESELSIYTRKGVTVKGLTCELGEKAKIKYQLYYFDKDGKFVSASEVYRRGRTRKRGNREDSYNPHGGRGRQSDYNRSIRLCGTADRTI